MPDKTVNMGLKLFPPPPKEQTNPSRKPSLHRQAVNPRLPESSFERSGSPAFGADGRQSALDGRQSALGGRQTPQNGNGRQTPQFDQTSPITTPPQAHIGSEIPRSHTSFSEAPTLIRSNSNSSNASHTKATSNGSVQRGEPAVMRSMFPRYNPELALEHQAYFPTQQSPTHIPPQAINRRPYSPSMIDNDDRSIAGLQSPAPVGIAPGRFPSGVQDETILEPSTTDELKEFWKVVNGWRVSSSEGRRFCLKMTSDVEEPVHTLSSATQPFYTLRLIPTSTSAQMTMLRHDPNKAGKGTNGSPKLGSSSSAKQNAGAEVMSTTLEETARRLPPNDGLVALLYPKAASDMVIELANKSNRADADQVVAAAERECGRLVWDEDSRKYYLVHPAISTPFVVSIHSSPAWSRVEVRFFPSSLADSKVARLLKVVPRYLYIKTNADIPTVHTRTRLPPTQPHPPPPRRFRHRLSRNRHRSSRPNRLFLHRRRRNMRHNARRSNRRESPQRRKIRCASPIHRTILFSLNIARPNIVLESKHPWQE